MMASYITYTSVVFRAFQSEELRRNIVFTPFNFYAPDKLEVELLNKRRKILRKTRISKSRFKGIWKELQSKIKLKTVDQSNIRQAESILRETGLSLEDKFFFALSLYLKCPYWTFEKKYWKDPSISNALRARGLIAVANVPFE